MTGHLARLGIKPKVPGEVGLPKPAVPTVRVSEDGAEGDYNNYRTTELAGDPEQALLVVTEDLLGQLDRDGWPVRPGDLGENLTLAAVAEAALGPGVRLSVGRVTIEITKACVPCTELYTLPYIGQAKGPAFLRAAKGRRGWYAKVVVPGILTTGDPITILD